jgi:hypothetical protein
MLYQEKSGNPAVVNKPGVFCFFFHLFSHQLLVLFHLVGQLVVVGAGLELAKLDPGAALVHQVRRRPLDAGPGRLETRHGSSSHFPPILNSSIMYVIRFFSNKGRFLTLGFIE